jgi:protein-S-isoprenylcysteine O-methyltransferase Ste14
VVCAVLWFVARRQVGTAFSVKPQARQLVAAGFYAKLRHPIYVFGTMAFLLVLLALQGWAALAIWAVGTCLGFDAIMKATEPRCYLSGPRSVPR